MGNPYQEEVRACKLRIWVLTCPKLISYTVTNFLRYVLKLKEVVLASPASFCLLKMRDMFKKDCKFSAMARTG